MMIDSRRGEEDSFLVWVMEPSIKNHAIQRYLHRVSRLMTHRVLHAMKIMTISLTPCFSAPLLDGRRPLFLFLSRCSGAHPSIYSVRLNICVFMYIIRRCFRDTWRTNDIFIA